MYYTDAEQFKSLCGYEIDGFWYPRVTKILEIKSKPALYYYYAEAASFSAASSQTQKSAAEGTKIHEAAEKIFVGEDPQVDEDIAPSITAFKEFLASSNIQVSPEHVEKRVIHYDHRYAGTIDTLALIDGRFGVLDIKTSQAIYRDYNLQTSAYMAAMQNEFPNLQTRWILRIDQIRTCFACGATLRAKGGREKIRAAKNGAKKAPVCGDDAHQWSDVTGVIELQEFPYWHQDFEAFLAAKRLWEWENEYWLKKIGY
ncbi:MAG: hypothetical protein HY456_01500 [Parcubacteria group bacterium]|nr:hypothetical protein [Parcubacteria group bacterium]